jgi:hypothetical protein
MAWPSTRAESLIWHVRACRRRVVDALDVLSTALGLLINLAEACPAARAALASAQLPGGGRVIPLLCRLMQARPAGCHTFSAILNMDSFIPWRRTPSVHVSLNLPRDGMVCAKSRLWGGSQGQSTMSTLAKAISMRGRKAQAARISEPQSQIRRAVCAGDRAGGRPGVAHKGQPGRRRRG